MWKQTGPQFLLALLVSILMVAPGCTGRSPSAASTPDPEPVIDIQPLVSATAVMVPAQWSTLSLPTAGVVAEVLVQEGETVEVGQLLVRLDGKEDLQAAIAAARAETVAAQQALDNLNENASRARTEAQARISTAQQAVREAKRALFYFTVPSTIAGYSTEEAIQVTTERLDTARKAFEPYKNKTGTLAREQRDLKEKMDRAESDYNSAVRRLELELSVATAENELTQAHQDYAKYQDGPSRSDLLVAQARLENAQAALAAAEAKLEDLELKAPFGGTISRLNVRVGEWVVPGQPALILADLTQLHAETTDLNEIDVARVQLGDAVLVTFDALPEVQVDGTVTRIAPKAAEGSGVNYTVLIDLDALPEGLRWGMTAFVDIKIQ